MSPSTEAAAAAGMQSHLRCVFIVPQMCYRHGVEPIPSTAHEVPVDVLPPVPRDAHRSVFATPGEPPLAGLRTFYHPASGVVILGIDILIFGPEFFSGFLALPVMCALAFMITFPLVFLIQKRWGGDTGAPAMGKAFLGAFMAGLPFSIAGTIYGAAILALSGLPHHPLEMAKRLMSGRPMVDPK
jgi:hypothetical protein